MQSSPRWRFGTFIVDPDEQTLLHDGRAVALTHKAFVLLLTLVQRPGRLLTKAELFDTVWAGSVVSDAALSRVIHELRRVLGDAAAAPRFIATVHGLGFRFIADVVADRQASPARADLPANAPRPVGRETELAQLEALLSTAQAGQRQIVFVTGEAGIGKTALVQAFAAAHAADTDLLIAQGHCIEQYGTAEAYLPILAILEQLARHAGSQVLGAVLARYAPAWLALLPWLSQEWLSQEWLSQEWLAKDEGVVLPAGTHTDMSAQRMLREIAQALEELTAQKALVLWLEDLHWSDPSSLAVVAMLAGRPNAARLMLICSFRPADARQSASPLHGLALRLMQRGQACELSLGPLSASAVAEYLRSRLADDQGAVRVPIAELGTFIHRRTDGNALFTVTMVDDMVGREVLKRVDGAWLLEGSVADLGHSLPDDLRRLVHDQVDRLSDADRRLIEAAAIAGSEFSAAAVAAALQAETVDAEDRFARLAEQGRFLRQREPVSWPDGTTAAGFGFLHAVYWQAIHERVPLGRRAEWHMRIGLRQERAHGAQSGLIATELAMHFERAREFERALRYLQIAGSAALAHCAYTECIGALRRALTLVRELPPTAQPRAELDVLLPLGAALMAAQGYAAADVDLNYQRALQLCALCGRPGERERVMRGLWNITFLRADLTHARMLADQLLQLAESSGDANLIFDAHTKLGQACLHLPDLTAARDHLARALNLPGISDNVRSRALPRIAVYEAWVLWYSGQPAKALRRVEDALQYASAAESPHSSAFALGYAGWVYHLCGDLRRAEALGERGAALSAEHDIVYWRTLCEFLRGRAVADLGNFEEGIRAMRQAIASMRLGGALVGLGYLHYGLAEVEVRAGQYSDAAATLAAAASVTTADNALSAAEALRVQGLLLLGGSHVPAAHRDATAQHAEHCLLSAIKLARQQGARSLELRSTLSLSQLWVQQERRHDAYALIAPLYGAFTEGHDTADLVAARALLDQLGAHDLPRDTPD